MGKQWKQWLALFFFFLVSKISADGVCGHEIKRHLLLGRKVMTNLDSILKSRNIALPTKIHLVKAMVFPVVMYGCESWTYKGIWVLKNWCFWTAVLEKTLESPLNCKEIQPVHPKGDQDWCWSWKSNTLATWCKELTHLKGPWCWERLKAEGEGDNRGWDGWIASLTQWTWVWIESRSCWWTGRAAVHGVTKSWTRLSGWTESTACSWWGGFGSSLLATLPLGFNCSFISSSACGSSSWVCSWGCPGGLGFAPIRVRCEGDAASLIAGVLSAPHIQECWRLGQQEI